MWSMYVCNEYSVFSGAKQPYAVMCWCWCTCPTASELEDIITTVINFKGQVSSVKLYKR